MAPKSKKRKVGASKQVQAGVDSLGASPDNGEGKEPSKRAKALNAAAGGSPAPPASTVNGLSKGRKKKGLKSEATDSPGLPPSSVSGSEEEGKKKKRKSTSSQSELALPHLAAPRQYDAISREKWRLELHPTQVVKISMLQNIAAGLDRHLSTGGEYHGSVSRGDKDGVWVNLCEAQRYINRMAEVSYDYLGRKFSLPPKDCLTDSVWATPLISVMESAARSSLGAEGEAMVWAVKSAVSKVCGVNKEYDRLGNAYLDTLLDAYVECMGVVSSLWLELCGRVREKFAIDPAALDTHPWVNDVTRPWKGGPHENYLDGVHSAMITSMRLYPHKFRGYLEGPTTPEEDEPDETEQQQKKKKKKKSPRSDENQDLQQQVV